MLLEEGHFIPPRKGLTTESHISLEPLIFPGKKWGSDRRDFCRNYCFGVGHTSDYTCAIFCPETSRHEGRAVCLGEMGTLLPGGAETRLGKY